ncbi:MAG: hypothetical protein HOD43_06335 [Candidatus Marinimicrobia bacterium]|jgi:hypothetical protein|nr:hypothetical protein [Candidatus Neomarinimicrobiota bacterium]MBT3630517.1 hypothetical protein [Candidatus Neomarinimicrobiota bacterium]MBT3823407.1 hypothetical protein [Candidatus Neomarinimicrobiota bacterium]MBT4131742.1 hypothetical protein [Candidatus Neomarinimicrobiota bacterium]MBT4295410.1 hypothetical protein [Candidatus Neomarinimicrobiota bacterium]
MKLISKFNLVLFLSLCTQVMGQTEAVNLDQFIGDWHGEGHFYNVNLSAEVGLVRFTLRVTPDMEITGSVGNAEFVDAEIEIDDWNDGYKIQGTIVGPIFPNSEFHKKRMTLLLKEVQDDITIGDFHLASNFIFDFSMRPGEITLRRNP